MNMKEIKNMKKLSILFISSLIGTAGLMTHVVKTIQDRTRWT